MAPTTTRSSRGSWRPAPRNAAAWKEIRQAARIAHSENVEIELLRNGSTVVRPLDDSTAAAGDRRRAPEKTKEKKPNGSSNPDRTATAGGGARERREQRSANRQRAAQARIAAQAAPPPAAAEPQPEPPTSFGALNFEPMGEEPDYQALWRRFNSPFLWRVRKEYLYAAARRFKAERNIAATIVADREASATRSPGEAGLATPSPSRNRRKSRRGQACPW